MRRRLIIVIICSVFLYSCKKTTELSVNAFILEDYAKVKDTVIMRNLIYQSPELSGWVDFLNRFELDEKSQELEMQQRVKFYKKNHDDFFWEKVDRDSLKKIKEEEDRILPLKSPYYYIIYPMTYRIIDTISLKNNRGYLVLKNNECFEQKRLYLSIYNKKDDRLGTYLVSESTDYTKHLPDSSIDSISTYSEIHFNKWLYIYTKKNIKPNGDYILTRSLYNIEKQVLLRTDTLFCTYCFSKK